MIIACPPCMTGEAIFVEGGHYHKLWTKTDFYEDHFHPIRVQTDLQVIVGEGEDTRHVHFIDSETKIVDEHFHEFIAATLINDPIGDE